MKRKRYTRDFKLEAVRLAEESDAPLTDLAFDLGIHPNTLYKWRRQLRQEGEEAFPGSGKPKASEAEVRRLHSALGYLTPVEYETGNRPP